MLTETVCTKVLQSEVWKLWSADTIVKMQLENQFPVVPSDLLMAAIRQALQLKDTVTEDAIPGLIQDGTIGTLYMQRFSKDRPSLKWMVAQIPKNCAYSVVKPI